MVNVTKYRLTLRGERLFIRRLSVSEEKVKAAYLAENHFSFSEREKAITDFEYELPKNGVIKSNNPHLFD